MNGKKRISIGEILTIIFSILSVGGIIIQMKEPLWNTGSKCFMYVVGGDPIYKREAAEKAMNVAYTIKVSHAVSSAILLIPLVAMIIFIIAILRGNIRKSLKITYLLFAIFSGLEAAAAMFTQTAGLFQRRSRLNVTIFFITTLVMMVVMILFLLREAGRIRYMPSVSAILLFVIAGMIVSNGLIVSKEQMLRGLLYGLVSAMPAIAFYIYEIAVLRPRMRKRY